METEFRLAKHLRKVLHLDCEDSMQWISVKEKIPEHGQKVSFKNKKRSYSGEFCQCKDGWIFMEDPPKNKMYQKIQYWMPIPKPPEE